MRFCAEAEQSGVARGGGRAGGFIVLIRLRTAWTRRLNFDEQPIPVVFDRLVQVVPGEPEHHARERSDHVQAVPLGSAALPGSCTVAFLPRGVPLPVVRALAA